MSDAEIGAVYAAIEAAMPHEALREIAPGELERVAKAAIAASSSGNWRRRAERMADMHREMCVENGRLSAVLPDLLGSLKRLLLEFDFLVEDGTLPEIRKDIIFVDARHAIAKAEVTP